MKCLIVLSFAILLVQGSPVSRGPEGRIIGGHEAEPHSLPHQVGLMIDTSQGVMWCGGSLIARNWVLTAAHCVDTARQVVVALGAHDISVPEPERISIQVTPRNIKVHRYWNPDMVRNDIALIKLPYAVTLTSNIKTVKLPTRQQTVQKEKFVGLVATASGWGKTKDREDSSPARLREVQLPVMATSRCNSYFYNLQDQHICVSGQGRKGACNGDSGGPLTVKNPNGSVTQIGIASFVGPKGCEAGWPTVYTRVTYYMDWIEQNTGLKF